MFFLLFPVGTSEPVERRAWVTYLLVIANTAVFLAFNVRILVQLGPYNLDHFLETWGYVPDRPSLETAFASMFLHGGFFHLALNMWPLLLFGRIVEDRLGHLLYLVLCLGSGLAGVWLHDFMSIDIDREMALVGASGVVSGVMGGLLATAFWAEFRFFFFYFVIIRFGGGITKLISFWICLYFTGFDFLRGYINYLEVRAGHPTGGGVAVFAHIAGFLVGLGLAAVAVQIRRVLLRPRLSLDEVFEEGSPPPEAGLNFWRRRKREGRASPEQREADAVGRLVHRGHASAAVERFEKSLVKFPRLTLPPPLMLDLAEMLQEEKREDLAWVVCQRTVAALGTGGERIKALLMLGRLSVASSSRHVQGLRHLRELLALDPDHATRREAERLMMRLSGGSAPEAPKSDGESSLAQRLQVQAEGRARAAYLPEPIRAVPDPQGSPLAAANPPLEPPARRLPPARPAYTPDDMTSGQPRIAPTHAVILTSRKPIDVPRVAQVVARATQQSMVQVADTVSRGMGIVLETDSFPVAHQVANQLSAQHIDAACVRLEDLPSAWELTELRAALVEWEELIITTRESVEERLPLRDLLTIAHAAVPRMAADPRPPLICDLLLRSTPRRLRAVDSAFTHGTPGEPPTLRAFALLLGQRAAGAERDSGIVSTLATHQDSCLRFGTVEQFERYQRWLALCALARR